VQWTLRRLPQPLDTLAATEQLGAAVAALDGLSPSLIGEAENRAVGERAAAFEAPGAPADIAHRAAALETLAAAGDLVLAARSSGLGLELAIRLYFRLGERLSIASLVTAAHKLPREGQWAAQAAQAVQDELATLHADLLASALKASDPQQPDPEATLARWSEPRRLALERIDRLMEDLAAVPLLDLAMLSVATAELRSLV
jgi:glutamate dehydrogenase